MPTENWTEEKVYFQKEDYFVELETLIRNSRQTIDLETYIFETDVVGQKILSALIFASERGVSVRVTVDGVGSYYSIASLTDTLSSSSVRLKIYHPFLFPLATKWKWLRFDLIVRAFTHLNKRLHRKVCIIDREKAFIGSFNITNQSNHDIAVRVSGESVSALLSSYEKNWRPAQVKTTWSSILRLNDTKKFRSLCNNDLAYRVQSARKRVWITNAYFVPPLFILKALWQSGRRGVDVRLLVPARSDQAFMKLLTNTYYGGLLQNNIRIFEYQKKFLHAKTLLIDDWAVVGSSNMNHRSMFHDLEVDVVLSFEKSRWLLERQFESDQKDSTEIKLNYLSKKIYLNRFIGWLLHLLFRNWL